MSEQIRQRAKTLVGSRTSANLVIMLGQVNDQANKTDSVEQRSALSVVRVWICDELEKRHPEVSDVLDAWIEGEPDGRDYFTVLAQAVTNLLSQNAGQLAKF
jgi:hypothetical protein